MTPSREKEQLSELLKDCTAHVRGGPMRGTGFFVAKNLLMTASHVAGQKDQDVMVKPFNRKERPGKVVAAIPYDTCDVALVEVGALPNEQPQPAVLLTRRAPTPGAFAVKGFGRTDAPEELGDQGDPGLGEFEYRGRTEWLGPHSPKLILIDAGEEVPDGVSGAALLSHDLGAVVGIVQYRRRTDAGVKGGGALPIAVAAEHLSKVAQLVENPPPEAFKWRDVLGDDRVAALAAQPQEGDELRVVKISGDEKEWSVSSKPGGVRDVTVDCLRGKIDEALWRWLRHGSERDGEEVRLAGKLLGAALMSEALAREVRALRGIRLEFADNCTLKEVPWELATLPDVEHRFQPAAKEGFEFVRGVAGPAAGVRQPRDQIHVQGLIPEPIVDTNYAYKRTLLEEAWEPDDDRIEIVVFEGKRWKTIAASAEWPDPEIVHYVGYGRPGDHGPDLLIQAHGPDNIWLPLHELLADADKSGARLVVVQTVVPPIGEPCYLADAAVFERGIDKSVAAIIYTQFPVMADAIREFNDTLYHHLGQGDCIEKAVQGARRMVHSRHPPLAFGSFALLTGAERGMRLLTEPKQTGDPYSKGGGETERKDRKEAASGRDTFG